jgi:mandelate racemase
VTAQALTISSVEIRTVSVPLRRPVVSKVGLFSDWPMILVDLRTREGVTGRSYLEPYLRQSLAYLVPAIRDLVARVAGTPIGPFDFFQQARASLSLVGLEGMSLAAVSAVDMALWDALARATDKPLAVYLGGTLAPVPAYNSNGLWLTDPAGLRDDAASLVAEGGFKGLKLRLGRDRLADDLAAIEAVRAAAGQDVLLMVDFNQGLTFDRALRRCHELDDQGLYWLEEPIAYDNLTGFARLREELDTPIQIGENFWGPRQAHQALAAGACDFIMPDLMRIGGVTGWLRAAAIAGATGTPVSSHLYPEFSAHLLRVTETAHWLEWQDWADPIIAEPFPVKDGMMTVPDRPGAGIEWNEAAVKRFAIAT